jgi:hypothetical protein
MLENVFDSRSPVQNPLTQKGTIGYTAVLYRHFWVGSKPSRGSLLSRPMHRYSIEAPPKWRRIPRFISRVFNMPQGSEYRCRA